MDQLSGENSAFAAHLPAVLSAPAMKAMRHNARASHQRKAVLTRNRHRRSPSLLLARRITKNATIDTAYCCSARSPAKTASPTKTTMPATPMARPPAPKRSIWSGAKSAPAKKIAPNSTCLRLREPLRQIRYGRDTKPSIRKGRCQRQWPESERAAFDEATI